MGLVQRGRQPASLDSAQRWAVWAVRLLIVVLALQATMLMLDVRDLGILRPGTSPASPAVEVVPAPGTQRPTVAETVDVRSYTRFYVNDKLIAYSPEDLTDGVEYAVNYLGEHPGAQIRMVHTVNVKSGKR